ncbi:c-type cytochrome [Acidimicrobiia bacterium]|nr:c-type cytochrome [Acidimicrobiia bacterium]MDB4604779.1 c-type cytochrome [Acidimicrobiia bacterium]MDC0871441.1 c-type cytochrome [Acidimicrobiia bacterium]MDC3257090.1 c-type cytochrome [Acidimicrobiia bacterium]
MGELLAKVAEILGAPETLVQRSAEARAEASGNTVEEVLQSWAGGEAIAASAPVAEEAPVEEVKEEVVAEEAPVEEVKEEVVAEEVPVAKSVTTKVETVIKKVSMANNTMGIKLNTETTLPRWLNFSFMIIPVFILIGMINTSGAQECGVNGILDVDRKSQQTVNCDGSPFEGKGVASTNAVNYVAVGQQVYSGAAACAGCHGANGGGGVGPSFIGGALYKTFPTCADHAKWIQLGSAGWQAEVGAAYGAEDTISIGGMPGFQGKLTEEELMAVVVFERVVFGGGNTEEVLIDCGLLETEEEEENIEAVSTTP